MERNSMQNDEARMMNVELRSPNHSSSSSFVIRHFIVKAPLEAPPEQAKAETGVKERPGSVIDTSKMSKGKREALELAEASRDPLDERGSFASNLFIGRYDFGRIYPWPEQSAEDRAAGEGFLRKLEEYLRDHVDADEIDRTGEIPQENF